MSEDEGAVSVFDDIPDELSPNSDFCINLLRNELMHSGWSMKFRINDFISENDPSRGELAKFLKEEYGIGGGRAKHLLLSGRTIMAKALNSRLKIIKP